VRLNAAAPCPIQNARFDCTSRTADCQRTVLITSASSIAWAGFTSAGYTVVIMVRVKLSDEVPQKLDR